jgi:predicted amidohydrolase
MQRPSLRVAAAQYPIERLRDWAAYQAKARRWVEEAAEQGAELLLLPEYAGLELAGLFAQGAGEREQFAALQALLPRWRELWAALARDHGVHIVPGTLPVRQANGACRNRAWLFAPNGRAGEQDKLHLTAYERSTGLLEPGDAARVFETTLGRLAIAVCYDTEFPEPARAQARAGAWLILVPSATDTLAGQTRVRIGCQARALENQCYVAQAPTVGAAPWCPLLDVNVGAAGIYAPPDVGLPEDGVVVAGTLNAPGWVYADLSQAALEAVRATGHVRNFSDGGRCDAAALELVELRPG